MKASVEWLKEYSDINVSGKELGDLLTMSGSKLETVDSYGKDIINVVVGKRRSEATCRTGSRFNETSCS